MYRANSSLTSLYQFLDSRIRKIKEIRIHQDCAWRSVLIAFVFASTAYCQTSTQLSENLPLSLDKAEQIALTNQPRLVAAQLRARAAAQRIREARSAYQPIIAFNATGALVADTGSSTAAGNLTTSAVSNRFAYGGTLAQLVTDFGRTSSLVQASRFQAEAQNNLSTLTKAQIRLNVREAYYGVLGAESVLHTAQVALTNRKLIAKKLNALAQSELRSTLDANFAEVLAGEAELALVQAQGLVTQKRSLLASSMGLQQTVRAPLIANTLTTIRTDPPEELMKQALEQRADLRAAEDTKMEARATAQAEKKLSYPTLNVLGAAGQVPLHDHTLLDSYAAAGFTLNIPIFNGNLFSARRTEAQLESNARERDVAAMRIEITQQVRDAWSKADIAYKGLDVTARLVEQSKKGLLLAQDRYEAGLGSIVELNEAQLNETSAEMSAADAMYSYLSRCAELDFVSGLLN